MTSREGHIRFYVGPKVERNLLESIFHAKNPIQANSHISTIAIPQVAFMIPVTTVIEAYVCAPAAVHHPLTMLGDEIEMVFIQTGKCGIRTFVNIGMHNAFDCMRPLDEMFDGKADQPWIHTGAQRRFIIGRRSASS